MTDGVPDGATPIDPDEAGDLLPSHIRTREELNIWEQENILRAAAWAKRARSPAHPFPNGNGRHARLWCDMLLEQNGRPVFTWKNRESREPG